MRLFDGSGEYVRADEIAADDTIREEGEWRPIIAVERTGNLIRVICGDGYGFECPPTTRILKKIDTEGEARHAR